MLWREDLQREPWISLPSAACGGPCLWPWPQLCGRQALRTRGQRRAAGAQRALCRGHGRRCHTGKEFAVTWFFQFENVNMLRRSIHNSFDEALKSNSEGMTAIWKPQLEEHVVRQVLVLLSQRMHELQLWQPSGSTSVVGTASLRRAVEINKLKIASTGLNT